MFKSIFNANVFWAVVVSIIVMVCVIPRTHLEEKIDLSDLSYDMKKVDAPSATGFAIKALAWIMSSRLGPTVARHLFNGNNIKVIREMGVALDELGVAPLYMPMYRVSDSEWNAAAKAAEIETDAILENIFNLNSFVNKHKHNTIADYRQAYLSKRVTPLVVMERTLAAIADLESKSPKQIIFAHIDKNSVLKQANESTARYAEGKPLSPFDGVPIAFKDMVEVLGLPSCNGQSKDSGNCVISEKDDPAVVAPFRERGAIILGTTVMTEGGVTPLGYSAHWKGPLNAYSSQHYSGGSSSGSAVAVASNIVPVAIGYDGGGSIRIPSAWSGLHGLATTFGRIPFATRNENSHIKSGPMTHSAHDAIVVYHIMAQHIPKSYYSQLYDGDNKGPPPVHISNVMNKNDLNGVVLGIFDDWYNDSDIEVRSKCDDAILFLHNRGAIIKKIEIPHLHKMALSHGIKISTEFAQSWDSVLTNSPHTLESNTKIQLALGSVLTNAEVDPGQKLRQWAANYVQDLFKTHNLTAIVTPTIPMLPPVISHGAKETGESNTALIMAMMRYIFLANFIGLPGYTVPIGTASRKTDEEKVELPVGLHLLGGPWMEHKLLRIGNALDDKYGGDMKINPDPSGSDHSYFVEGLLL